jgi:hypothetical protein
MMSGYADMRRKLGEAGAPRHAAAKIVALLRERKR